jgi:tRNA(fMet)-specific endonuclease VapC
MLPRTLVADAARGDWMFILDTDTLSHFLRGHSRVTERVQQSSEEVVITMICRIEILQGRFASVLKAEDGERLVQARKRLEETEKDLEKFTILDVSPAAAEFDRLRDIKKLKKIGRGDVLIVAIVLANRATLVTRNVKDFLQVPGLRVENWAD